MRQHTFVRACMFVHVMRFRFRRGQFSAMMLGARVRVSARAECACVLCVRINFNQVKHEKQTRKGNEANCILRVCAYFMHSSARI